MDEGDLTKYGTRTLAFLARYVRARPVPHAAITLAVLAAVGSSVTTQYGVKRLVDALSAPSKDGSPWLAFGVLLFELLCGAKPIDADTVERYWQ